MMTLRRRKRQILGLEAGKTTDGRTRSECSESEMALSGFDFVYAFLDF
jgi:hypothetical protein